MLDLDEGGATEPEQASPTELGLAPEQETTGESFEPPGSDIAAEDLGGPVDLEMEDLELDALPTEELRRDEDLAPDGAPSSATVDAADAEEPPGAAPLDGDGLEPPSRA